MIGFIMSIIGFYVNGWGIYVLFSIGVFKYVFYLLKLKFGFSFYDDGFFFVFKVSFNIMKVKMCR